MANPVIKKIYKKIKQYDEIVIARHVGPDPDAVGSQMALRDAIRLTFPSKKVYAVGNGVSKFKSYGLLDKVNEDELTNALLIIVDVPGLNRVDGADAKKYKEILKIDHHPNEGVLGEVEWTNTSASSAAEMVAELIINSPLKMDEKIASNLFLGIVSDSDRFLITTTTIGTFETIVKLLKISNIDFTSIYPILYERPINETQFGAFLTNNLTVTENGLGYVKISKEDLKQYNVDVATPSNMINEYNNIKEVIAWVFITEDEAMDRYRVSIRSRGPIINLVAQKYHGGGHKFASGIKLQNASDIENVIEDLDTVCKEYKSVK